MGDRVLRKKSVSDDETHTYAAVVTYLNLRDSPVLAVHRVLLCGALLLLLPISSASTTSFCEELRAVFEWLAVFPHAFKDDAVSPVSAASP